MLNDARNGRARRESLQPGHDGRTAEHVHRSPLLPHARNESESNSAGVIGVPGQLSPQGAIFQGRSDDQDYHAQHRGLLTWITAALDHRLGWTGRSAPTACRSSRRGCHNRGLEDVQSVSCTAGSKNSLNSILEWLAGRRSSLPRRRDGAETGGICKSAAGGKESCQEEGRCLALYQQVVRRRRLRLTVMLEGTAHGQGDYRA